MSDLITRGARGAENRPRGARGTRGSENRPRIARGALGARGAENHPWICSVSREFTKTGIFACCFETTFRCFPIF